MTPQDVDPNPGDWQKMYLDTRAWNRVVRQFLLIGVPFLLIIFWLAVVGYMLALMSTASLSSRLMMWGRFALPLFMVLAGAHVLFRTAHTFIFSLYRPSSESEADVKDQIGLRLLGWHGLLPSPQNYVVVTDTRLSPVDHWSKWLGGPASLIINDGLAVYLERGNCFSRVVGAGFPFPYLDVRETIKAVVDLRPQIRPANINAWTKDGIRVNMKARVEFQIESGDPKKPSNAKLAYPFDPLAVRWAVEYTAVRMREGKLVETDWHEGVIGNVTGLIARHISSHRLDELFLAEKGDGQILHAQVMEKLLEKANGNLKMVGLHLIALQITDIVIPDDVRRQRLNVRGAEKYSLVARIQGEAQAYKIRTNEEARAKAQRDLIVMIAKSLERVEPSHFPEFLILSLSNVLDQGLKDPLVQTYMARETLDALKTLQNII